MVDTQASIEIFSHKIVCCGNWTLNSIQAVTEEMDNLNFPSTTVLDIDLRSLGRLDTAGAWLLNSLIQKIHQKNIATNIIPFDKTKQRLLTLVGDIGDPKLYQKKPRHFDFVDSVGKNIVNRGLSICGFLGFVGELSIMTVRGLLNPLQLQWKAIISVVESAGSHALPIVGLLSFLVGVVLAYQMGMMLRNYGASIYIVDVLGVSILREFSPLITAIIIAGRTGSAFAAEIGTMIINEEVDALKTMGINPVAYLALPKLLGMILVMPLLVVWADIFGVLGGMVMSKNMLGINYIHFIDRFRESISLANYVIGIVKTPLFAMIIAIVGCFQGFQVVKRSDSVGIQTTKSVVQAIFLIIIADSAFSILFSWAKI